jgi:hypothetical protein
MIDTLRPSCTGFDPLAENGYFAFVEPWSIWGHLMIRLVALDKFEERATFRIAWNRGGNSTKPR